MENICYSIGYDNRSLEEFIRLIRTHGINCIIDLRNSISINNDPVYDSQNLKISLNKWGIYYIFMGQEFAIQKEDLKSDTGYLEKLCRTDELKNGIERIISGMKKGYTIALMSKEKEPFNCFRGIFLSRLLEKHGVKILHISGDGNLKPQKTLEEELVKGYGAALVKKVAELSIKYIMKNKNLEMDEADFKMEMLEESYRIKIRELVDKNGDM